MTFIDDILKHKSLSIVGLEKNTGKTVCLNYILNHMPLRERQVAVTSIGLDGESQCQVTNTAKPPITLRSGIVFSTSETHYRKRRLVSELLEISDLSTSLGRVVTARVIIDGQVMLSGPSTGQELRRWQNQLEPLKIDLTIIDGALSRLSSASPAVSQAMVLATGAAYSHNLQTLVKKTAFVVKLVKIEAVDNQTLTLLNDLESGVWALMPNQQLVDTKLATTLGSDLLDGNGLDNCTHLFVAGALTDRFLNAFRTDKRFANVTLVVRDFTKIFVSPTSLQLFENTGRQLKVLHQSKLIGITVNPTAPDGYSLNSLQLCHEITAATGLPTYDLMQCN